ncbi:MAG: hypothetical protein AcusKO_50340 [Acuticoccus sp.]
MTVSAVPGPAAVAPQRTALAVLWALSLCHLLNDTIQSLLPAIYPVLQENYALSYTKIGILHFAFQLTASLLQPAIGLYTDKRPLFRLSVAGMAASLFGLILLAYAADYALLVVAAMCVGLGSAVFHPDASRASRVPHRAGATVQPVALPGGRQHRHGAGAGAGGVHRAGIRPAQHHVVRPARGGGNGRAVARGELGARAAHGGAAGRLVGGAGWPDLAQGLVAACHSRRADVSPSSST